MRLWVDTDVGTNPDDAIALLLAVAHPQVELVGVSTVGADAPWRAEVASRLLEAAGAGGVPVHAGLPVAALSDARPDAVLAIGPLTGLARALPSLDPLPARVIMGGTLRPVRHRGAVRRLESNFAADPAAAAEVLAVPGALLVPLDVTAATVLDATQVSALAETVPVLAPVLHAWVAHDHDVVLHDPAALLVAAGEPLAEVAPVRLAVAADGEVRRAGGGTGIRVVVGLDAPAVGDAVLRYLGRAWAQAERGQ